MAKRKRPRVKAGEADTQEYETSSGVVVTLKAMPPLLVTRMASEVGFPDKPTYEITTAAGDVEIHEHEVDEAKGITTLESDEDKKAWDDYVKETEEAENRLTMMTLKAVLLEGVLIEPDDEQITRWASKQKIIGLTVPEDSEERLMMFKETEVVGNKEDMEFILNKVMELTGVSEEQLEKARASFQDQVEPDA